MKALIWIAVAGLAFAADDDKEAKALPDGPGKETVVKVCLSCHGAGNFRKKRLAKDDWSEQVADMIDRGAQVTETQAAAVVEYLTQAFGKESKIYVNTAPYEELKAMLALTNQETQAMLDYRKEKGDFKAWQDLEKVTGVDRKKIESKKELIVF